MRYKQEHKFSLLTFTCSKLTLETLEKDVECVENQQ